ncbi:hypothetical protein [Undibacterium squillarum]|uniref:hypothetical protein n=1 Tax=Undibacterium squillarum TaxID=1131567 RepID=UPI0035AF4BD8
MNLRWVKRISLTIGFLLLLVHGIPWSLYQFGLSSFSKMPEKPARLISIRDQQALWDNAGFQGAPQDQKLNPVSYILTADQMPEPMTLFAGRIAAHHFRQNGSAINPAARQLAVSALTIWLTRNWTTTEILSSVAELEAMLPPPEPPAVR